MGSSCCCDRKETQNTKELEKTIEPELLQVNEENVNFNSSSAPPAPSLNTLLEV